jgi:hypothetical protein
LRPYPIGTRHHRKKNNVPFLALIRAGVAAHYAMARDGGGADFVHQHPINISGLLVSNKRYHAYRAVLVFLVTRSPFDLAYYVFCLRFVFVVFL